MDNPNLLLAAGGICLFLLFFFLIRRNKNTIEEDFEEDGREDRLENQTRKSTASCLSASAAAQQSFHAVLNGKSDSAIYILEKFVEECPETDFNSAPWDMLMDLYIQEKKEDKFAELAKQYSTKFGSPIYTRQSWVGARPIEKDLESSHPKLLAQLSKQWGTKDSYSFLNKLIEETSRPGRPRFSAAVSADIVMLRDILHVRFAGAGIEPGKGEAPSAWHFQSRTEERFPHVANKLSSMWPERSCSEYLDELIIDTRGGREGFGQPVMEELLMLREILDIYYPHNKDNWDI